MVAKREMKETQTDSIFRKPVPEGVEEITELPTRGGIVQLKDSSLMMATGESYHLSTNDGRTWTKEQPLNCEFPVTGLILLQSGALAVYGTKGTKDDGGRFFASSDDEGQTWSKPSLICPCSAGAPFIHSMIQLTTGRLLLTMYWGGLSSWTYDGRTMVSVHPEMKYEDVSAYGLWRGQRRQI